MKKYCRIALKYDDNKIVRAVLENWKEKYPTRKAMQQMIDEIPKDKMRIDD